MSSTEHTFFLFIAFRLGCKMLVLYILM